MPYMPFVFTDKLQTPALPSQYLSGLY